MVLPILRVLFLSIFYKCSTGYRQSVFLNAGRSQTISITTMAAYVSFVKKKKPASFWETGFLLVAYLMGRRITVLKCSGSQRRTSLK